MPLDGDPRKYETDASTRLDRLLIPRELLEGQRDEDQLRWYTPLVRWLKRRHQRVHDRHILASLNDRSLRDIGLDRASVDRESTASFWRHPL
jgi:uncharacterized protein YjiS (DUF1127 family)